MGCRGRAFGDYIGLNLICLHEKPRTEIRTATIMGKKRDGGNKKRFFTQQIKIVSYYMSAHDQCSLSYPLVKIHF